MTAGSSGRLSPKNPFQADTLSRTGSGLRASVENLDFANNRFAKLETATTLRRRIPIGMSECAPAHLGVAFPAHHVRLRTVERRRFPPARLLS